MSERQNIEYKQSWHDDYLKWVCGFANAVRGIICIGKDNNKGMVIHVAMGLRKSFGITSEKKIPNPIKALFIIVLFPEATAEQIGEILGVSSRSAETYIQKLKSEGILERAGGKKEGSWQIKMLN